MKSILILALLILPLATRAADFAFRPAEITEIANAIAALDGYEKAVDQGPVNNPRVIRENYKFAREVRAKLGANLTAIKTANKDMQQKFADLRLKISGDAERIDEKDPAQLKLWNAGALPILNTPITLDLSPISNDELALGDNPIPPTVLSVLNLLREPAKK